MPVVVSSQRQAFFYVVANRNMTEIAHPDVRCEREGLAESEITSLRNEEMNQAIRADAHCVNGQTRVLDLLVAEVSEMSENSERGQIHHDADSDDECLTGAASQISRSIVGFRCVKSGFTR